MRVVVPYTELTGGCKQSLDRAAPHAELIDVSGSVLAYHDMMKRVWADGEDFILIEHDLDFNPEAIEVLEECPHLLCSIAGYWRLTRFRSELIRSKPDLFEGLPLSERHWIPLEWCASNRLLSYDRWHYHYQIPHHNDTRGLNGTEYANLYTSESRAPVWYEWMRTLPPEAADQWTARAWAEVADDGRACSLPNCRRSGPSRPELAHVCDRCRHENPNVVRDVHGATIQRNA